MESKIKTLTKIHYTACLVSLVVVTIVLFAEMPVNAADTNLANGITVDSPLDTGDGNIGDGICDDGDGNCTLRAAIEEANTNPDSSLITFAILGGGVQTIQPATVLPGITEQTIIDGYTQPGSVENSAISPRPFNGTLQIEIDGSLVASGNTGFSFAPGSDGSAIRGLAIGNFNGSTAIMLEAENVEIQGNYIGTNALGTLARPNEVGVSHNSAPNGTLGTMLGGLDPEDRNIISGNTAGSTAAGAYPVTGWVVQGNYVGLAADGISAIENSNTAGSGAFSIDDCSDVLVGGTVVGATNVISGNASFGIAPHNSPNTTISGNLIGTDWTGTNAVPNATVGIALSGDQTGTVIGGTAQTARNVVSGNTAGGIVSGSSGMLAIEGNIIGLDTTGHTPLPNGFGVILADDSVVGGSNAARNVISGNAAFNVSVQGTLLASSGAEVSGNYIGTNIDGQILSGITAVQGEGVRVSANVADALIGGVGKGNLIAGNRGNGVAVRSLTEIVNLGGATISPAKVSIVSNQIAGNIPGGSVAGSEGLGIDLYNATIENIFASGLPADIQADSYANLGVTANDPTDSDTGPNNFMNFPVLRSIMQNGNQAVIQFDLDAADSPTDEYRVEFFANDFADESGHGEGQEFIGATTVSNGVNLQASFAAPNNLAGKYVSATTTAVDSTTRSGFGSTSELSAILFAQNSESNVVNNGLASTGRSAPLLAMASLLTVILNVTLLKLRHTKYYKFNSRGTYQ